MTPKPVAWLGDSREQIRNFPDEPRHEAGYQLERVQARKTAKADIELARRRFKALAEERKRR